MSAHSRKKGRFSHLDRDLCRRLYTRFFDSLFDLSKLDNDLKRARYYASVLAKLECFVEDAIAAKEVPFVPSQDPNGQISYRPSPLAHHYYRALPDFIAAVNLLSPMYDYSERIEVFSAVCAQQAWLSADLRLPGGWGRSPFEPPLWAGISTCELFNQLVRDIRNAWKSQHSQNKANTRQYDAEQCYENYCRYLDAVAAPAVPLLSVHISLGYKNACWDRVWVAEAIDDLNRLVKNKRSNSLFRLMKGYIAKLVHTREIGLYWQVIFFFDDSEEHRYSHIHLLERIGNYWIESITQGRGDYQPVTHKPYQKGRLKLPGPEAVAPCTPETRDYFKGVVLPVLCLRDQFIKPKFDAKVRLLRRGNFPKTVKNQNKKAKKRRGDRDVSAPTPYKDF